MIKLNHPEIVYAWVYQVKCLQNVCLSQVFIIFGKPLGVVYVFSMFLKSHHAGHDEKRGRNVTAGKDQGP